MKLNRRLGISDDVIELIQSITEKKKLDPVDKKAVKKDFDDRKDKDIDNDGDVDKSDKYLHNRRKAVSKAMSKGKGAKDQIDTEPTLDDTRNNVNEEGIPTGIKIHHQNPQGKKGHMIVFTARDAQRAHKELKKDGHTVTGHQLMYGTKAGPMHKVNEEVELDEMDLSKHDTKKLLQFHRKYADKRMSPSDANQVRAVRRELIKRGALKEDVELDEAQYKVPSNYASMMMKKKKAAQTSSSKNSGDALMAYAKKSGGIDKASLMKLAGYLQNHSETGNPSTMADIVKMVKGMDTEPRDQAMTIIQKNDPAMYRSIVRKAKLAESLDLDEAKADRLQMIKKAAEKIKARDKAAARDARRAMKSPGALKGMASVKKEATGVAPDAVDKHNCATHVYHEQWGEGQTIYSMHADPDDYGLIEWYDVMFEHGIEKAVPTNEMTVTREMSHGNHKKKK